MSNNARSATDIASSQRGADVARPHHSMPPTAAEQEPQAATVATNTAASESETPVDTLGAANASASSGRKSALGNMAWLLADKAFALIVGLGIFGLVARNFGPAGSGHFAYGSALLQTGLGLSMVCAGAALLPRFCRIQGSQAQQHGGTAASVTTGVTTGAITGAVANVFALRLLASTAAMLLMMVFAWATTPDPSRLAVTLIMLLSVPLLEPFYIFATYWLSRNHNRPTVVARSSGLLLRAAAVCAGVWLGAPMWLLALAWTLEAAVNATLQTRLVKPALPRLNLRRWVRASRMRRYLDYGLRFVLALWLSQLFLRLDRLVLAQWLDPHEFGIYAAPMQLVEVWAQVAYLVGSSIATAYLYRRMDSPKRTRAFVVTAASMASIGLAGLLGAWLLGPWLLGVVFGPAFLESARYLVAGAAFAVMLFADQAVDMMIMANNQPRLLTLKWAVALAVAAATMWLCFDRLGALVGPVALATGLASGWLALLLAPGNWHGPKRPSSSAPSNHLALAQGPSEPLQSPGQS